MMHGQFLCNLEEDLVDTEQSYQWLKSGDIKGEMEGTTMADHDQALNKNCFKNNIFREDINSKCRLCTQHEENNAHQTSFGAE
jgi:hypothetical protein